MYFKSVMRGFAFLALALVLSSCTAAEPRVPGHSSYCFKTTHTEGFGEYILEAEYSYGEMIPYTLNANHVFSSLTDFYPLTVRWITIDGISREENIPIPNLVRNLKVKKHWIRGRTISHEPCLHLRLTQKALEIDYVVGEMIDKGPAPGGGRYTDAKDIRYPVFRKQYNFKEEK